MSLCDRLEQYFKARPGQWIDGMALSHIAGCYAWRSRVSDLRKRGLQIENRTRKRTLYDGGDVIVSEYRYLPADLLAVAEAQERTAS